MNLLDLMVRIAVQDDATGEMEGISAGMIAKGQLMADGIKTALQTAIDAIKELTVGAVEAYATYEQMVGGMETLFKGASDTVIANAKRAYETAGMSANQYMENVTSLATKLVKDVSQKNRKVAEQDTSALERELDNRVSNMEKAQNAEYKAASRNYSRLLNARQEELDEEYRQLQESLSDQLNERQKANAEEVEDFRDATEQRVKEINREYTERLKLTDEEEYKRIKALEEQNEALDAATEAERKATKARENEQKKADLLYKAANEKFIEDREKAERELGDFLADLERQNREEERNNKKKANREEIQRIRDEYSERRSKIKEEQSKELEEYKEARSKELKALQESNSQKLEEMRKANAETLRQQQKANKDTMTSMRESQQDQLEAMRESQQEQLRALRDSVKEQKKELKTAADNSSDYVQATEEDYEKAIRIADMAMRDMADNHNKMGTNLELLEQAYNSMARGSFRMLDSLRLGYGETRAEAERMLSDAEAIKARQGEIVDYSIDSFADIVEAIHVIQTELGISGYSMEELEEKVKNLSFTEDELNKIANDTRNSYKSATEVLNAMKNGTFDLNDAIVLTGTTMQEGKNTIEGALNRVSAAWENWLVSLADPEWDVAESTRQLMESVGDAAGLIIPRVATILETLFTYVSEHGPEIWEQFKQSMMDSLPEEWQTKVGDARKAIEDFFGAVETAGKALQPFVNVIIWAGNEIKGVADIIDGAIRFITGAPKKVDDSMDNTDDVLEKHGEAVMDGFARGAEWSWDENKGFFSNIGSWIQEHKGPLGADAVLLEPAGRAIIDGFMGGASSSWNSQNHMFGEMASSIGMMFNGSENLLWTAGHNIIVGLWNGMIEAWNRAASWVQGIGSWIQEHKGPESYDKSLLVKNGKWIVQGLHSGLEGEFERSLIPYVGNMADEMENAFGNPVLSHVMPSMERPSPNVQQRQPKQMTVILELDRVEFGRMVYELNNEEVQRVGVNLTGGMA